MGNKLASMNWRRSALFAGIHLVMLMPLIYMSEDVDGMIAREVPTEESLQFAPCSWVVLDRSSFDQAVRSANLPVVTLTGWRDTCPAGWTLSGLLHVNAWTGTRSDRIEQKRLDLAFALLVCAQWLTVGGAPLIRPKRWWIEPGAFITVCAFAAIITNVSLMIFPGAEPPVRLVGMALAEFAALGWWWWLALLAWCGITFALRKLRPDRL